MTYEKYELYWGIMTYKNGKTEAIAATSEEAYWSYQKYHVGCNLSSPNYGYIEDMRAWDKDMMEEVKYDEEVELKEKLRIRKQKDKMAKMTTEEKVNYILESFDL